MSLPLYWTTLVVMFLLTAVLPVAAALWLRIRSGTPIRVFEIAARTAPSSRSPARGRTGRSASRARGCGASTRRLYSRCGMFGGMRCIWAAMDG